MNIQFVCEKQIYKFVIEYIESIITHTNCKLLLVDNINEYNYLTDRIYICLQRLPNIRQNNILLLNIEQLTRLEYRNNIIQTLKHGQQIIDYSIENINLIKENLLYIPYQYNKTEIKLLENLNNTEKIYDIVFIGCLSERRKKICQELEKKGIKILYVDNKFGIERDKEVVKGKILLNLHFSEEYNIYESFRCDRWIFSKMMVISENSLNNDILDISDLIIFTDYDNIVNRVVKVVNNYSKYLNRFLKKHKENIEKISMQREKNISKAFKNIHLLDNNLTYNTLEVFSANWRCNMGKDSFVKYRGQLFILSRGYNIFTLSKKNIKFLGNYDCCLEDYSFDIQQTVKKIYDKKEEDYLIIISHDDCTNRTNSNILQNYLIFLNSEKLKHLQFRGSYFLLYDLKKQQIIDEIVNNSFPIHEWYEFNGTCNNLGVPVYLIVYNLYYFVKNSIEQLKKYTKNIHIIDNKSTYPKLLDYYDEEYEFFLHKMEKNCGHLVWKKEMYYTFPQYFIISDPDLEYNKNLPDNFIDILKNVSNQYKKGKVGFALDISDSHLFYSDKDYCEGTSIENWEKRFWLRKIEHPQYELYNAPIDTTFCLVNKEFEEVNNAIRIAGNFTCKHIPWYKNWYKNLEKDELDFYINKNISSGTIRMLLNLENKNKKELVNIFNDIDKLVNFTDEITAKIKKLELSNGIGQKIEKNLVEIMSILDANKQIITKEIKN